MTATRISTAQVQQLIPQLSDRDLNIVQTVGHFRYVRGSQLERLYFAELSPSCRSNRRNAVLRRLIGHKLLTPLERRIGGVRAGSAGLVYALGPAGQRLLQLMADEMGRTRTVAEPNLLFLEHKLDIVEVFTLVHESELEVLQIQEEPENWRQVAAGPGPKQVLKPDLYLEVAQGDFVYPWYIEVDRATERTPALRKQMKVYQMAYERGFVDEGPGSSFPAVLWLVPDERRVQFVKRAIAESGATEELFDVAVTPTSAAELTALLTER